MSQEEENFKQQLDELLSARSFQFQEAAWQDMSALLDAKKRKRRLLYFWWIGLAGGLIGIATWLALPTKHIHEVAKTESTVSAPSVPATLPSEPQRIAPTPVVPNSATPAKLNEATPLTPAQPKQIAPVPSTSAETPVAPTPSAVHIKNTHPTVAPSAPAPSAIPALQTAALPALSAPTENTLSSAADNKDEPVATDLNEKDLTATKPQAPLETDLPAVTAVSTVNQQVPQPAQENLLAAPSVSTAALAAETATNETASVMSPSTEITTSLSTSSLAAAPLKPDTDYVKKNVPDIRLELGTTYLAGWADAKGRDGRGFNPLAGIVYNLPLGKEIKLGFGLQYTMLSHLKYSEYTATVSRLDLGKTMKSTVFTPTRIHYLLLPLKLHLKLDDKQSAGIGLNLATVLTVVDKVQESQITPQGTYEVKNSTVKGYNQGFSPWDAQVSFFYQRKFAPHFYVNAELMYGLTDVKNGQIFKSAGTERNSGIKLSVLYSLFSK